MNVIINTFKHISHFQLVHELKIDIHTDHSICDEDVKIYARPDMLLEVCIENTNQCLLELPNLLKDI